jgi:hypothetical protein
MDLYGSLKGGLELGSMATRTAATAAGIVSQMQRGAVLGAIRDQQASLAGKAMQVAGAGVAGGVGAAAIQGQIAKTNDAYDAERARLSPADQAKADAATAEQQALQREIAEATAYATGMFSNGRGMPERNGLITANTEWQAFMAGIDRFQKNILPANTEYNGYTFITRPRLNLSRTSILTDRILSVLALNDPYSFPFVTRAFMDTRWARQPTVRNYLQQSPYFNVESPFWHPLMNSLVGLTGWPDINIQVATSEGGFHSETQSHPQGYDYLNRGYEFTMEFREPQGAPITSSLIFYLMYLANLTKGTQMQYLEDILDHRMAFTFSVYRFLTDPSRTYITSWAKATGCFFTALRIGNNFDVGEGELFVKNATRQTARCSAHHIDYNDYIVFHEFNQLMEMYCKWINTPGAYGVLPPISENNFLGLPYIAATSADGQPRRTPARIEFRQRKA